MSLRDQLLKAGLVSKKQANEAERQAERQARPPAKRGQAPASETKPPPRADRAAQAAKTARDQTLNRLQHEKAEKKAKLAQIRQWVEQNRIATIEGGEPYNFLDGAKIRRIAIDASIRGRLSRGEIVIVRNKDGYDLVPAAIATRIRERDPQAVIISGVASDAPPPDEGYERFTVPDDLIW